MKQTILICLDNTGSGAAKLAISELKRQGNKVIILNKEEMEKQSEQFAKNAIEGNYKKEVKYIG